MSPVLCFSRKSDSIQMPVVLLTLVEQDQDGLVAGSLEGTLQVCPREVQSLRSRSGHTCV